MKATDRRDDGGRWIEPAMAAAILSGLVYCGWHLLTYGYLPPPFLYDAFDTYADWFNPAFWARNEGTYDVWRTVYPPLSFVFLRIFGLGRCYPESRGFDGSAGLAARDCDWLGLTTIWLIFLINLILIWLTFRKLNRGTALPRTICVALGLPMVYALERGNLVLVSVTCLILALGPLVHSARLRWTAAGLAVNFKIYLIAAIATLLLKRRWRWVESAMIAVILVYLFSYAALGRGTPLELFHNIRNFADMPTVGILDVWYSTTYQSLMSLLEGGQFPLVLIIGSRNVEWLLLLLPALQHLTQALILLAALAIWFRPGAASTYRAITLGLLLALVTSEAGGYTQVYFIFFVMMEPWRGFGRRWAIMACYVLALPVDIILDTLPEMSRPTYFGDAQTMISQYVTLGPFVRPLIVMSVAWALSLVTIREVWRDIHEQRWADRWRFRRDASLLPWVRSPRPPV